MSIEKKREEIKPFILKENRSLPFYGNREFPPRKSVQYYDDKKKRFCTIYFDLDLAEEIVLSEYIGKKVHDLFSKLKEIKLEPTYINEKKFYMLFENQASQDVQSQPDKLAF